MAHSASALAHMPLEIRLRIFSELLATFEPRDIASPLSDYSSTIRNIRSLGGLLYDEVTHCKWLCQHVDTLRHEVYPHGLLPKISCLLDQYRLTITPRKSVVHFCSYLEIMQDFSSRETGRESTVQSFLEHEHDEQFPISYRYKPYPQSCELLKLEAENVTEERKRTNVAMLEAEVNNILQHMTLLGQHYFALRISRRDTTEWKENIDADERVLKWISMLGSVCRDLAPLVEDLYLFGWYLSSRQDLFSALHRKKREGMEKPVD